MGALPMDTFRMGGIEFGISFVAREKSTNDLKSVAGQHGLKLNFVDDMENGDMINVLSRKDEETDVDINGFLRIIRKQDCWVPDQARFDGYRVMIFYHKEVLS